jgi:hypothetical protein
MRISCLSRADFLDEDALEEPEQLAHYKAIFVTQPNVPAAGTRGLLAWVKDAGGMSFGSGSGRASSCFTMTRSGQ